GDRLAQLRVARGELEQGGVVQPAGAGLAVGAQRRQGIDQAHAGSPIGRGRLRQRTAAGFQTSIIAGSASFDRVESPVSTGESVGLPVSSVDMRISQADELLLSLLREDARASTANIARRLGLSRTTVQNRIARLEQQGVIRGYTVRVDDELERSRIRAHILITLRPKQMTAVVKALQAMHEVRVLYSI